MQNADDMYVIAHDIVDASDQLNKFIEDTFTVGDINTNYPIQFNTDGGPEHTQHGIYLHGHLQDIVGYDIVYTKNKHIRDGIHNVEITHDKYVYPALLYFWTDSFNLTHGLIIFRGDAETKFVYDKYSEKSCLV